MTDIYRDTQDAEQHAKHVEKGVCPWCSGKKEVRDQNSNLLIVCPMCKGKGHL